jgi:hypothetical protein
MTGITVKPGTAPGDVYVGVIEAIDALGIRITLIDWIIDYAASWDFFIPHSNVDSILIATEHHDQKHFGETAASWRNHELLNST